MAVSVESIHPEIAQTDRPFTREVRLGLVLFGGTSLAIYINGVTREFARIVRGEGAYAWLKALTDSDVVIDIVSGTSAGGINGIVLAYALANGKDPTPLSTLWREHGDISGLFRQAGATDASVNSLFESETYRKHLQGAFDNLGRSDYRRTEASSEDFMSQVGEIDLFITGTRVEPRQRVILDSSGNAQKIDDYRALFLLKHRPGRKQPFDPSFLDPITNTRPAAGAVHKALAMLANVTSCFPGAFSPVPVRVGKGETAADDCQLVCGWGKFDPEEGSHFFDGGVLDNKPFMSTLEAIFSRPSARLVDRRLFYVEPDPAPYIPGIATQELGKSPTFLQTAIKALSSIPRAEPIIGDLTALADHNRRVASLNRITRELHHRLPEFAFGFGTDVSIPPLFANAAAPDHLSHYERVLTTVKEPLLSVYVESRKESIALLVANALYAVLEQESSAEAFLQAFSAWAQEPANEERLLNADIYFLRRRLSNIVYFLHELLSDRIMADHRRVLTQRVLSDVFGFLQVVKSPDVQTVSERDLVTRLMAQIGSFLHGLLADTRADITAEERARVQQVIAEVRPLIPGADGRSPEPDAPDEPDKANDAAATYQVMETVLDSEPAGGDGTGLIAGMLSTIAGIQRRSTAARDRELQVVKTLLTDLAGDERLEPLERRVLASLDPDAGSIRPLDGEREGSPALNGIPDEMGRLLADGSLINDLVSMKLPDGTELRRFIGGGFVSGATTRKELDDARIGVSRLLTDLNRLGEVYEVIRIAVERLVSDAPAEWRNLLPTSDAAAGSGGFIDLWRVFAGALERLLAEAGKLFPSDPAELAVLIRNQPAAEYTRFLSRQNDELGKQIKVIRDIPPAELRDAAPNADAQRFIEMLDACEARLLGPTEPTDADPRGYLTLNLWNCYEQLDAVLYPVESVANAGERDLVEVHRISAVDARVAFSDRHPELKVSGDAVGHFGGFLKRSWRSNDILWGRLDGCCRLIEVLLDEQRVKELVEADRDRIRKHFFDGDTWLAGMRPAVVFPNAPKPAEGMAHPLETWLEELLGEDEATSRTALERLPEIRKDLIEAAQFEILYQDLAMVFEDQYLDEAGWNNADLDCETVSRDDQPPVLDTSYLDEGLTGVRAVERSVLRFREEAREDPNEKPRKKTREDVQRQAEQRKQTIATAPIGSPPMRPSETRLGQFFIDTYRVGAEPLTRVVPPALLINWVTHALLLLRTCLVNSVPGPGGTVQRSTVFRFAIEWPLRALHWFTGLWMREPLSLRTKIGAAAWTTLILGLIVNLFGESSCLGIVLLIGLPATVLFIMPRFSWVGGTREQESPKYTKRGKVLEFTTGILAAVAVALLLATVWTLSPDQKIIRWNFDDLGDIPYLDADRKWFPIIAPYGVVAAAELARRSWRLARPLAAPPPPDQARCDSPRSVG